MQCQSEVNDMKTSCGLYEVGQPQAANKIVKDWILEEAPPEPEPEPATEEPDDSAVKRKEEIRGNYDLRLQQIIRITKGCYFIFGAGESF